MQDQLTATFPGITVVQIRQLLERTHAVLGKVGLGVRFLGVFATVARLAILGACVAANARR